jgi:CHAT domain-containing protein
LLALFLQGCKAQKQETPETVQSEIVSKMQHGEFDAALQQADRAAKNYEGQNPQWYWQFRILAARTQVFRGQYQDAIARLRPPLPIELEHTELAVLRQMALADAEDYSEQFSIAEADLAVAERLAISFPPTIQIQVLQTRANLEYDQKNYFKAEAAFRRVLDMARDQHLPALEAEALGSLGSSAMGEEHYDEATDFYKASLQLARSAGRNTMVSTTLGNLGWSFDALGDYESARDFFTQAEQAASKAGQRADRVSWLFHLANVYTETNDFQRAKTTAEQALDLASQLGDPYTTVQSLNMLTEIALETNHLDQAEKYNRQARAMEAGNFDHGEVVNSELNAGRIAERSSRFAEAEQHFKKVSTDADAPTPSRWESQARLANLYREAQRPADAEREFRLCLKTIATAQGSIRSEESRLSFLSSAITFYGEYIDFLISAGRTLEALQIAETSRARTLAEGLGSSAKRPADGLTGSGLLGLSKRLHNTLLCYWMGRDHSHLWVITPAKTQYFRLAGFDEIDRALKGYREALLASRDALHPVNRDGATLYSLLLEPAQALIPMNTQVTILPDASLYSLNFETLIVPGPEPHYWIEDVSITTASSLTLLAASTQRRAPAAKKLLLIGNTDVASSEFPKLPQAAAEMQTLEHYFPPADREVLEGQQATPAAYLSGRPDRFAYLHFVTHGTASLTKPMDSAVILSPGVDTYKLYARDIVTRRLNADLVTISACNGAGTRAYSGEGLVGLSWAFLRAGAHNVIAALWEVNDTSTSQLMDALYSSLRKGQPPATALRAAKLFLLHSATVYSKPYYWAPFQLYAGS